MATPTEGIKFYTITETVKALKVTPQTNRALIKKDKKTSLSAVRPALIPEHNVKEFSH